MEYFIIHLLKVPPNTNEENELENQYLNTGEWESLSHVMIVLMITYTKWKGSHVILERKLSSKRSSKLNRKIHVRAFYHFAP
jgi:hypothetical protein